MRIIYGSIAGLIAGYTAAILTAPRSGQQSRENLNVRLSRPVKDIRMTFNKVAYKLGIISEKKKAQWNKDAVEALNAKLNSRVDGNTPQDTRAIEKAHETAGATKAVTNSTAKNALRKVPVNAR